MELQFTNIFRTDETNIGDSYSTPTRYFDLPGNQKDIYKMAELINSFYKI